MDDTFHDECCISYGGGSSLECDGILEYGMDSTMECGNLLNKKKMEFLMGNLDCSETGVDSRFGESLSRDEVERLNGSIQSKNTNKRNKWALRIFDDWLQLRHPNLLQKIQDFSPGELNDALSRFIHEVRRKDDKRFPNTSLVSILAGLNAILFGNNGVKSLFRDETFKPIMTSLDASMKISTRCGAGISKSPADYITLEEEELLWSGGQLGDGNPVQLSNTLFYLNGLHFGLRGGEEQSLLSIKQFTVEEANGKKLLRYQEMSTKTYSGGQ